MVKLLQRVQNGFAAFLGTKTYDNWSSGSVRWYGGYPYYFADKKTTLDANTIIQACLGWEARNFCEPPVCIQTLAKSGEIEKNFDHPLCELMRRPEPEGKMTGRRLIKAILASRRLDGNAYIDITASKTGKPAELRFIPHWCVEPIPVKGSNLLSHYEIRMRDGTVQPRNPEDIVHFADGIDPSNPLKGCSALKSAMRLVMTDNAATASGERIMRNLGIIGLMVSPDEEKTEIKEETRKLLTAQLNQQFGGEAQGSSYVASRKLKVDYMGTDASKLGFREMHRVPEERITAIFGYAAIVIGLGAGLDRSTFANFAEAREAATEQTLVPLWTEIADDITVQLGPRFGLAPGESFAYDLTNVKILQEDEDKRWSRLGTAFEKGGIKRSEYRRAIGYEATPEDEVYFTDVQSGTQAPLKALKDEIKIRAQERRRVYESLESLGD